MAISSIQPNGHSVAESLQISPQEAAQRRELLGAVRAVNASEILGQKDELVFVVDTANRRAIARLVDKKTREVVLQLPPEYVLRLAADLNRKR